MARDGRLRTEDRGWKQDRSLPPVVGAKDCIARLRHCISLEEISFAGEGYGPARCRCSGDLPDAVFGLHYRRSGTRHGVVQGLQLMARRCLRKIERAVEVRRGVAAAFYP